MDDRWAIQNWTTGELNALVKNLGGEENARKIQRGEMGVKLEEAVKVLFDKNGRRIPKDFKSAACDPDKDFCLVQPRLRSVADYSDRLIRFQKAFREGPVMSAADLGATAKELITEIENNKSLRNLLNGVYLPIILPQLENFTDYGKTLEEIFIPAVKYAYEKQFPGRKFNNHQENDLMGKVIIVPGTRHKKLIEEMTQGYVFAIYFPNSLQGFSISAAHEQIVVLSESLILAGGFDTASAIAMYPDVLARDWHTPGYDLSALAGGSPDRSLYFKADDDKLTFLGGGNPGATIGHYSSGLLFLGSV